MKLLSSMTLFLICLAAHAQDRSIIPAKIDSTNFNKLYPYALRGNMGEVFDLLEKADDLALTEEQRNKKKSYYDRFVFRNEDFDFNTDNEEIVDLYKRFQNYWRSVILENVPQQLADSLFRLETNYFLKKTL